MWRSCFNRTCGMSTSGETNSIIWDKSNKATIWVTGEVRWGWQHKIYQPPQPSKQREMKQTFLWSSLPSTKCICWLEATLIHDPLEATIYLTFSFWVILVCGFCSWNSDLDLGSLDWIWTTLLCATIKENPLKQTSFRDSVLACIPYLLLFFGHE